MKYSNKRYAEQETERGLSIATSPMSDGIVFCDLAFWIYR